MRAPVEVSRLPFCQGEGDRSVASVGSLIPIFCRLAANQARGTIVQADGSSEQKRRARGVPKRTDEAGVNGTEERMGGNICCESFDSPFGCC